MSWPLNMVSRLVSFPSKEQASFNFMAAVSVCSDFGAQEKKICHCFQFFPSICHQVMGPDAIILGCLFVCLFVSLRWFLCGFRMFI